MIRQIDARGLRCPWPAIRLARALRDGSEIVEIIADDPAAGDELARLAQAQGALIISIPDDSVPKFRIVASSAVNRSFTREA